MPKLLEVKSLSHRYDKRKTDGIDQISFTVDQGSVLGLIGPSGSGKTTTLKCIKGDIVDYQGEIVFNQDVTVSYLDLNESLPLNLNVTDYLLTQIDSKSFPSDEQKINQIRTALSQLEITNEINSLIGSLSGGQRQRLIIAKSLINNPTLLLLDEPFSNLDNILRNQLLSELFSFFKEQDLTIIWVTHNTQEALAFSDELAILNFGKVQQLGQPMELYFTPQNLFVAQFFTETNLFPTKLKSLSDSEMIFNLFKKDIVIQTPKSFIKSNTVQGQDILIIIHPENISINNEGVFTGTVLSHKFKGSRTDLEIKFFDHILKIEMNSRELPRSTKVKFNINWQNIHCLPEV